MIFQGGLDVLLFFYRNHSLTSHLPSLHLFLTSYRPRPLSFPLFLSLTPIFISLFPSIPLVHLSHSSALLPDHLPFFYLSPFPPNPSLCSSITALFLFSSLSPSFYFLSFSPVGCLCLQLFKCKRCSSITVTHIHVCLH